jgi:hypothetical protein
MLVTGCLSEWLQGEILSTPPESNNHLQNWTLKLQVLKTCAQLTYFQKLCPCYFLYRRHTLDWCGHFKVLRLLKTNGVTL